MAMTVRVSEEFPGGWSFVVLDGDLEIAGGGDFDTEAEALREGELLAAAMREDSGRGST